MGSKRATSVLAIGILAGIFGLLGVIVGRWVTTAWNDALRDVRRDLKAFIRAEVGTQISNKAGTYGVHTDD